MSTTIESLSLGETSLVEAAATSSNRLPSSTNTAIERLLAIMARLRDPVHGCAWDLAQNFQSIVPYTLEEAYEVADAIERQALSELREELGDLLFQVVFYSQMAAEQGLFTFDDCVQAICNKLERRHPHIFAVAKDDAVTHTDTPARVLASATHAVAAQQPSLSTTSDVVEHTLFSAEASAEASDVSGDATADAERALGRWERIKAAERQAHGLVSVLDNIPQAQPALTRAYKLQKRCANVGFDWPDVEGAWLKVKEEILEIEAVLGPNTGPSQTPQREQLADELGDLMFALVNVVRKHGFDPEQILRQANGKFERRFRRVEHVLAAQGLTPEQSDLAQMDAIWQQIKHQPA